MAGGSDFRHGPNSLHPEEASAVGSRNSTNRDGRDEYSEARLIIDEEVDKILNHINQKLPPEVMQDMHIAGNIKSYLHTYFNQTHQNMLSRYLTTAEDELGKKTRNMIDKTEHANLNRYTPREIAALMNQIGGPELFNTEEVEKSVVNIMGHLQGHIQRGTYDYENATTDILMQHTDVGGFVRGENTYAVVKCSFRDSIKKPDKVVDIKLAINILNEEMISPIVHHQIMTEHLIRNVIAEQIHRLVDREVEEINQQLTVEGRSELSPNEAMFEKFKAVENYTDDEEGEHSNRYQLLPRKFMEKIQGLGGEIDKTDFDSLGVREGIAGLLEDESLRTRGWNTTTNALSSILDNSRMGYQHVENYKNARRLVLREYEETDQSQLPDECFEINLKYADARQIQAEKIAYSAQLREFEREIIRLWDVVEQVYQEEKERTSRQDWDDLMDNTIFRDHSPKKKGWFQGAPGNGMDEEKERLWNEITFVQRKPTTLEEMNQTYEGALADYKNRLTIVRSRLGDIFGLNFPDHRLVIEQRLNFLENEFIAFMANVNPYHIQPGLILELDVTSIKRKRVTIKGMTNVLNEFLAGISKGFSDIASAHFEKRRSHVDEGDTTFG